MNALLMRKCVCVDGWKSCCRVTTCTCGQWSRKDRAMTAHGIWNWASRLRSKSRCCLSTRLSTTCTWSKSSTIWSAGWTGLTWRRSRQLITGERASSTITTLWISVAWTVGELASPRSLQSSEDLMLTLISKLQLKSSSRRWMNSRS